MMTGGSVPASSPTSPDASVGGASPRKADQVLTMPVEGGVVRGGGVTRGGAVGLPIGGAYIGGKGTLCVPWVTIGGTCGIRGFVVASRTAVAFVVAGAGGLTGGLGRGPAISPV